MPVYDVEERWLRSAIGSVIRQTYPNWELCIADDASPSPHVRRTLEEFTTRDPRIKLVYRDENGHISRASNTALELATGEFIGLLDHDDELTPDALFHVVSILQAEPSLNMIYSDEDSIDANGNVSSPSFKPAWSRDLFYSVNYVTHFAVYRTEIVKRLGGFRIGFEGSQDYDLALRVIEHIPEDSIHFIPRILYHWRAIEGSVALAGSEKPYAHERARMAIREHFERTGVKADVVEALQDRHRVVYQLPQRVKVDLIVLGEDRVEFTGDDASVHSVSKDASANVLNSAASELSGDVILFLDGDLKSRGGISDLIAAALQPGIGAVGGRIVDGDGMTEQSGIVLGSDVAPSFAHAGYPREEPGNLSRNVNIGNFLAVSRSCLAVRRSVFDGLGGFDESVGDLFDVDFCLRVWETGKRVVVFPHVEFLRIQSPRTRLVSSERFRERWQKYAKGDPFCNPSLKRDGTFQVG